MLFTETQRKRKFDVFSTLEKNFHCDLSFPSTEDEFIDGPIIKKMHLRHSVEKRKQYSKNTYDPKKSYNDRNYKGKTYDNQPS